MTEKELVQRAMEGKAFAYAPYSEFSVGAALLCRSGEVFTGCNVENAAFGSTICAERTALLKAVSEGHRDFQCLAIVGDGKEFCWPCGSCRQMLYEFAPHLSILVARQDGEFVSTDLQTLLPQGFGPQMLLEPVE